MGRWAWPKRMSSPVEVVSPSRVDLTGDHLKCDANQEIHMYGVVAVFLKSYVGRGLADDQIDSFLKLTAVLDTCVQVKDGTVQPDCLKRRCNEHIASFLRAYGDVS
eukprot:2227710-Pyramimonas_sp.AAC.1